MLKNVSVGLVLVSALAAAAAPAFALQTIVKSVENNRDRSKTYHFAVKLDTDETLVASRSKGDFVTIYNFYGLIEGSQKTPNGWEFSSEQSGRTPMLNGYPMVLPVDVPHTPNLTWTVTRPVAVGAQVEGFSATTRATTMVEGQYSSQSTRQAPAIRDASPTTRQAQIGAIPTPGFLAETN